MAIFSYLFQQNAKGNVLRLATYSTHYWLSRALFGISPWAAVVRANSGIIKVFFYHLYPHLIDFIGLIRHHTGIRTVFQKSVRSIFSNILGSTM